MGEVKLMPCPRCGNSAFIAGTDSYEVWCRTDSCLRLPPRMLRVDAIEDWNRRARPTVVTDEVVEPSDAGVPASPSGSRASHRAASASRPKASIPNAIPREQRLAYERRILSLEVELEKVIEAAGRLASIMRRNCENIDCALIVAEAEHKHHRRRHFGETQPAAGYAIEGFMPAVIEVEKVIAEATGLDTDDNWARKTFQEPNNQNRLLLNTGPKTQHSGR